MSITARQLRLVVAGILIGIVSWTGTGLRSSCAQQDPAAEAGSFNEQSIYIPYDKLRDIFEKEGRGVFIPYAQFSQLWKAARQAGPPPIDDAPPVDALIITTANEAAVAGDVIQVSSQIQIDIFKKGWVEVPLGLASSAITSATIQGEPARILSDPQRGYRLLYQSTGDTPESVELRLEYAKAIAKAPGRHSVSFAAPRAPVSRWRVSIPESGVDINLHPMIAATEVPGGSEKIADDQTVVLAFVGAAPQVRIDWTPKAEGAIGLDALVEVDSLQRLWVEQGVVRVRADLTYEISRAELPRLNLEVPLDYKVTNVVDTNVRQWSVQQAGPVQRVVVDLFEPAKGKQPLTIELERYTDDLDHRTLGTPLIKALGVVRQQGTLAIRSGGGLRCVVAKNKGAVQVNLDDLGPRFPTDGWDFGYRYAVVPFELVLEVYKIRPSIVADVLTEAHLAPDKITMVVTSVFDIQRAGVFQLGLDLPADYAVDSVEGVSLAGTTPASVDRHHLDRDNNRLIVNLSRRAIGKVALRVLLSRRHSEPDLLSPTGRSVGLTLPIPRVAASIVERQTGRLVVYAPDALRVTPETTAGLNSVAAAEALNGLRVPNDPHAAKAPAVLAYMVDQQVTAVAIAVQRRPSQTVVRQLLRARIKPGVVVYDARFTYDIRYSGVDTLRVDVPTEFAASIRNHSSGVRVQTLDPQPEDVAPGQVAWSFTGQREFLGRAELRLGWEHRLTNLEVGKTINIQVPRLTPKGVDRAWGQVVVTKAEAFDIQPTGDLDGLRPIDPHHDLMRDAPVADAASAFEFHGDAWGLKLAVTHYQLEQLARTSIERALVRMVVTRNDQVAVQALYRLRSARQRLRVRLPAEASFDTQPLRINGAVTSLERGAQDEYLVPLVGRDAGAPFILELRYTIPGTAANLAPPAFPDQPAVQKVYLSAYAPEERVLLGSFGPWTDEMVWRPQFPFGFKPFARSNDATLISWITEGIAMQGNPSDTFQTDGRRYLFSSLRPMPPPDGSLRLMTVGHTFLRTLIFMVIPLGAIGLLLSGGAVRATAVGGAAITMTLLGVFIPTFCLQLLDIVTLAAVCVALLIWATHYIGWVRPALKAARVKDNGYAATELGPNAIQPGATPTNRPPPPSGLTDTHRASSDHPTDADPPSTDHGSPDDRPSSSDEGGSKDE